MDFYLDVKGLLGNQLGLTGDTLIIANLCAMIFIAFVISWVLWRISRFVFMSVIERLASKTATYWDDALVHNKFFRKVAYLVPGGFLMMFIPTILEDFQGYEELAMRGIDIFLIWVTMNSIIAFISALEEMLRRKEHLADKPIASYTQLMKIVVYLIFFIIILSVALDRSPIYFLSAMGAMTAIILLVFKDAILGFVASIQIASNDMLREGDWVTMEKYGADGDVEKINLTTVKIRNFDRTISTIPTYSFLSDSFRNWRGMSESDGRRIKRAVSIKISTIKFCTPEMLARFKKYQLISDYLEGRTDEINKYNQENSVDTSELINGRNLTNIGVFRKYIECYLHNNPNINKNMTCMVRQLAPTDIGLPIEIYAFSADKNWVNYEGIMADVFDHILSVVQDFELEVFESPTGDLGGLKKG